MTLLSITPCQVHDVDGPRRVSTSLRVESRPVDIDGDEPPRRSPRLDRQVDVPPAQHRHVAARIEVESNVCNQLVIF